MQRPQPARVFDDKDEVYLSRVSKPVKGQPQHTQLAYFEMERANGRRARFTGLKHVALQSFYKNTLARVAGSKRKILAEGKPQASEAQIEDVSDEAIVDHFMNRTAIHAALLATQNVPIVTQKGQLPWPDDRVVHRDMTRAEIVRELTSANFDFGELRKGHEALLERLKQPDGVTQELMTLDRVSLMPIPVPQMDTMPPNQQILHGVIQNMRNGRLIDDVLELTDTDDLEVPWGAMHGLAMNKLLQTDEWRLVKDESGYETVYESFAVHQ